MDSRIELANVNYEAIPSTTKNEEHDDILKKSSFNDYTDYLKMEYFSLGLTAGASLQMLVVTFTLLFLAAYHDVGPLNELSKRILPNVQNDIFRIMVLDPLRSQYIHLEAVRPGGAYFRIFGLSPEHHTYRFILRSAASIAYIVFTCFVMYTLCVSGLIGVGMQNLKHVFPRLL